MADEIDAGKIVAEIVLETQQARENAEEFSGITLSYIQSSLENLGIKGQKATDMIQQGFASLVKQDSFNVGEVQQYTSALEDLSSKIENCETRKRAYIKVNDADGIERSSQAIAKLNQMYTSVQSQLDGYIAKMVKVVQTENEINELAGISIPDVVTEEVTLSTQSYADTIKYIDSVLSKLGITGEKAEKIISSCFQDVDNLKKYQNNLEVLSGKIETAKNRYQELAKAKLIAEKQGNTSEVDKMTSAMEKQANTIKSLEAQFDNTYIQMNSVVKKSVSNYNKQAEAAQKSADKQAVAAEKASQKQLELNKQLANRQAGRDFAGAINLATTSLRTFDSMVPDAIDGISGIITQINAAKQAMYNSVSAPLAWGTAIVASIGIVVNLITSAAEKRREAEQEAISSAAERAEADKQERSELEKLSESYVSAASKLASGNATYAESIELKKQLADLQDKLVEKYGDEAKSIDLINGNIKENIQLLRDKAVAEAQAYVAENESSYQNAKTNLAKTNYYQIEDMGSYGSESAPIQEKVLNFTSSYFEKRNKEIRAEIQKGNTELQEIIFDPENSTSQSLEVQISTSQAIKELSDYSNALREFETKNSDCVGRFGSTYSKISEVIQRINKEEVDSYNKTVSEYQKNQDIINSNGENIFSGLEETAYIQKINEYTSALSDLSSAYQTVVEGGKLDSSTLKSLCDIYPEIAKYINQTNDLTLKNGELIKSTYSNQQDSLKDTLQEEMNYLNQLWMKGEAEEDNLDKIRSLRAITSLYSNDIIDLQDTVEIYTGKMNDLSSVYEAVSDGGELDSDTLQDLIAQYPTLAEYISQTGDLTLANGEKIKEAYEEEQQALIEELTAKKQELELEKESSDSKEEATKQLAQINAQLEIYKNAQLQIDSDSVDWSSIASEVKSLASAYQTLNEGKQLDVDTMIQLIDKYPTVATAMANEGKLGKEQANVLKQLFEAKKSDYILTQQRTIANLQASEEEADGVIKSVELQIAAYKNLNQIKGFSAISDFMTESLNSTKEKQLKNKAEIQEKRKQAQARIKAMENLDVDTYGKSGGGSDNSNKALANELKQLEHKKAIGQLTSKQEYNWLVRINNRYRKNADEQMDMEKRLYNAKKQMQADEEAANTKALQAAYKGIENKKSLGKMNSQQELRQLEQIRQKYKMTAEERMELEIKIYNLKKSLKDDEISSINTLADAVTEALKEKYEEQRKIEEERINDSIESWQKWEDKTVTAIQGEIDALDELADKQESENKRQEYENKRQQTELQLAYEKDDYNRQQLQKELNRLDKEEAERLAEEQREAQKKVLQGRIEAVKGQSQATQERLKKELDEVSEKYDKLTDSFSLKAQAQKFIADSTQKQIISLIKSYASDYEIAGNTVGDALYNGMKAKMDNIEAYVDGIFGKIEAYQRRMANTANASADRFWASQNSPQAFQKQTASKSVTVQQTVNFNQPVESPVETRRQLDRTNQALAKQISSGI